MVKYIGSKRALIPWICDVITNIIKSDEELSTKSSNAIKILEPFAGSCRVGHALKKLGYFVIAGDYLHFSYTMAKALIASDGSEYAPDKILPILEKLHNAGEVSEDHWFVQKYSVQARYFQPFNAKKIAKIREIIEQEYSYDDNLKSILLTSLLLAADKVDSTTGVQMAYLKSWAPRSYNPLKLEYPPLLPGKGHAYLGDALEMAPSFEVDIAYLDPPYNQHSYAGNYHIWETLVKYDNPETYGVAQKRIDVKQMKSPFYSKKEAKDALSQLIQNIKAKYIVLSFNNEGHISENDLFDICRERGYPIVLEKSYKRYVGALIGIYNNKGEKVGQVSHVKNKEFLYVICPDIDSFSVLSRNILTYEKPLL